MKKTLPKILVICGPTATGKSDLAVKLAGKLDGEVISADSRQVYKGLDIGTGKITPKEMGGIPHHLIDIANPKKQFSVTEFVTLGEKAIQDILFRKKLPIICGGTGFYISALVDGIIFPGVKPDQKLRNSLSKKTSSELFKMLKKLDSSRAKSIDPKNSRRIIRAIEIATSLGKVPSLKNLVSKYNAVKIGLTIPPEDIKKRIHDRLLKRINAGMIEESRNLHKNGLSWKRMEELGLEYRSLAKFLKKEISRDEMIAKLNTEIWHYARRQMTWFRRDKEIKWFNPNEVNSLSFPRMRESRPRFPHARE